MNGKLVDPMKKMLLVLLVLVLLVLAVLLLSSLSFGQMPVSGAQQQDCARDEEAQNKDGTRPEPNTEGAEGAPCGSAVTALRHGLPHGIPTSLSLDTNSI